MNHLFRALIVLALFTSIMPIQCSSIISRSDGCCDTLNCESGSCGRNGLCSLMCSTCCFGCGVTTFIPRSQGANSARELVAWERQLFLPYYIENYITLAMTAEYTKSFRPCRIANTLFCTDCLTFSGSQAHRNNGVDVVADNFGLPANFKGTLGIRPHIQNYILDFNIFIGLSNWLQGLYFRVHAPLVHTNWSLGLNECVACADKFRGSDTFPPCYMFSATPPTHFGHISPFNPGGIPCFIDNAVNPDIITIPIISNNLNEVPYDCPTHTLREALSGDFTFGDMTERWNFGKFDFCSRSRTNLADLDLILGYNFVENDFGHFGLYIQAVAPTGTRPKAKFVFEPIVGNGKHWELGVGISAHAIIYNDGYADGINVGFYLEGAITNVFKNEQRRSFDFTKNGLLSRYLLLKEFDINNNYLGRMINAINFTTRNAEVHVGYKIDISAKLDFKTYGWFGDLGYNFYAKNGEKICIKTDCPCDIDQRRFGIKGIAGVCCSEYFVADLEGVPSVFAHNSIPMNATLPSGCEPFMDLSGVVKELDSTTQPNATMFTVTPIQSIPVPENACSVCLAYNSRPVTNSEGIPIENLTPENGFVVSNVMLPGNAVRKRPPTIISCADLDPNSAAQCSMLTHKIFGHIGYVWSDYCYQPHIGIGGEIELDGKRIHNSLNQWGVWLKGGITF